MNDISLSLSCTLQLNVLVTDAKNTNNHFIYKLLRLWFDKGEKAAFFIKVGSLFGFYEVQSLKMSAYSCLPHSCLPVTYSFRVRHCRVRNSFCDQHFMRNSYLQTRIYIKKKCFWVLFCTNVLLLYFLIMYIIQFSVHLL